MSDRLLRRHFTGRQGLLDFRQPFVGNAASAEAKSFQVGEAVQLLKAGVCDLSPSKIEHFKVAEIAEVIEPFIGNFGVTQIQVAFLRKLLNRRSIRLIRTGLRRRSGWR